MVPRKECPHRLVENGFCICTRVKKSPADGELQLSNAEVETLLWSLRAAVHPLDVRMHPLTYPDMPCQRCAPAAAYEIGCEMSLLCVCVLHSKWLNTGWSHVGHTTVERELNFYS